MVLFFLNHFVIPVEKICTASLVLFAGINSAEMLCDEKTRCGIMTLFNIEVSRKKKKRMKEKPICNCRSPVVTMY